MAILSLTDQQLLTINEKTKALQDAVTTYFSSATNNIEALLLVAETALDLYKQSLDSFVSATGNTIVGKLGFVFSSAQLSSAIAQIRNDGASNPEVTKLVQSISGMVGSAGLMIQAAGEAQMAGNATGSAAKMVSVGARMNNVGLVVTVTAGIVSYIAEQPVPSGGYTVEGNWNIAASVARNPR